MYGECELCGEYTWLEHHHIFSGPFRKKSEKMGAVAMLCIPCHRESKDAVHQNAERSRELKKLFQARIMEEQDWNTQEFIYEFGRNYI